MAPAHKEQWGGEVDPYMDNSNKLLVDAVNKRISTSIKQDLVWVGKEGPQTLPHDDWAKY